MCASQRRKRKGSQAMNKIIHGGTQITTVFHFVDDDENVIETKNAPQLIKVLCEAEFVEAYKQVVETKSQLEAQCQAQSE